MEQEGYFDQYLPVREVTVSASGYICTAPAAVPNPVADASKASCVLVTPTISPAPQNDSIPETSQNTSSANNEDVVTAAAAENSETAAYLVNNAACQKSATAVNSVPNVVKSSAASQRSETVVNPVPNVVNSSASFPKE